MNLRKTLGLFDASALGSATALAQDAKSVVDAASRAMGLDGVNSLYYYGSGAQLQPRPEQQRQHSLAADAAERLRARDRLHAAGRRAPPGAPTRCR